MSAHVVVNFTVIDNFHTVPSVSIPTYLASLTLTNTGNDVIRPAAWMMYGYIFMLAEPVHYPYNEGFNINSCGLKMFHMNGNLYRFQPIGNVFKEIPAKSFIRCKLRIGHHQISRTDSMPRWFFTGDNLQPRIIRNTEDESLDFVSPFLYRKQYQNDHSKHSKPYTVQDRYEIYKRHEVGSTQLSILPTPLSVQSESASRVEFQPQLYVIVHAADFDNEIQYLSGSHSFTF